MDAIEIRLQAEHCRERADEMRVRAFCLAAAGGRSIFQIADAWDEQAQALERRLRPHLAYPD